jgi:hypothetical protein
VSASADGVLVAIFFIFFATNALRNTNSKTASKRIQNKLLGLSAIAILKIVGKMIIEYLIISTHAKASVCGRVRRSPQNN